MFRFLLAWSGAAALLLLLPYPASADVTGLVRGHVTVDGAPRAGVTVTVSGDRTTTRTTTDAHGDFTFARTPFGQYTVTAHADGRPDAATAIVVTTDSVNDVSLAIGELKQIGRAVASARSVNGYPVSSNTISRQQIATLPQGNSLNALILTVPGIVHFSYNEPVAHGFHGVTYEIDGAPMPQTTSSNFSEIIDPRTIDSMEIFTGAFPAEFGGARQGAVINIITKRAADIPTGAQTYLSAGAGTTYGNQLGSFSESIRSGATHVFLNANGQRNTRGLDSPTQAPQNDNSSLSDFFGRVITTLSPNDTLAFDLSNQYNTFQIPLNTALGPNNPIVNVPGQNDVQLEYNSFANVNYTHTSRDGNGYLQIIPWWRFSRLVYNGDLANDVMALDFNPADCGNADNFPTANPCALGGLAQDRGANYLGVRTSYFRSFGAHAVKTGIDASVENFTGTATIALANMPNFSDNAAQRGTALGAYVQDNWTPTPRLGVQIGLRYDRSAGFTAGNELQPRVGANYRIGGATILHAYYGRVYAAPSLEDTRRAAVVIGGGSPAALPVYNLMPERDSYYEAGIAQTFANGISGYVNVWERNAWNVLDTTQIFPTPIFAVFNNALGLAHGYELRLEQRTRTASWFFSGSYSSSVAGGISGGTFLFPPAALSNAALNPEDHDQTVALNGAYTKTFAPDRRGYLTLGSQYGTGYPVNFQNGFARLNPHLTFDFAFGRQPQPGSLGFKFSAVNFLNYQYLLKVANGFNTTQWAPGAQVNFELQAAL